MKNNITELVFILDKSGSMAGLESDKKKNTVGSFFLLALTSMRLKQRHIMALIKTER